MCGSEELGYGPGYEAPAFVEEKAEEKADDEEPTQAEKEEAVREFAEWATTGEGSGIPFLDHEAIAQGVAEAEASGDWDAAFNNAAYAVAEVEKFAADPLGTILAALAEEMPGEVRIVGI